MTFMDHYTVPEIFYPVKVGNASCKEPAPGVFNLYVDNERWSVHDYYFKALLYDSFIEIEKAYGDCITTGLGFGIIELCLASKPNVRKVTIFEKHQSVVDLFLTYADNAKVNLDKIEILVEDANEIKNQKSDCLILDHFESETFEDIVAGTRKLSKNNSQDFIYFWPATKEFCENSFKYKLPITTESFAAWGKSLNIKNFPPLIDDRLLKFMKIYANFDRQNIKNYYQKKYTNKDLSIE